jgi:hypothetical protein
MGRKEREHDKHAAGGPGNSACKGHVEPDKSSAPALRSASAGRSDPD